MSSHKFYDKNGALVCKGRKWRIGGCTYKFVRAVSVDEVRVIVSTPDGSQWTDDICADGLGISSRRRLR